MATTTKTTVEISLTELNYECEQIVADLSPVVKKAKALREEYTKLIQCATLTPEVEANFGDLERRMQAFLAAVK